MHEVPQFILDRSLAREPIFTVDEVATWSEGLLDQLVTDGTLVPTDNAQSVACDACGDDHVEPVTYVESPPETGLRAFISCPANGRVAVPALRLKQWRLTEAFIRAEYNARAKRSPRWLDDLQFSEELNQQLWNTVNNRDLTGTLGVLAADVERWSKRLKYELFDLFHGDSDPTDLMMCDPAAGSPLHPFVFIRPLVGQAEAVEMLEIHFDVRYAEKFGGRLNAFNDARGEFADIACTYSARFGNSVALEDFVALDERRKSLKHMGLMLVENISLVVSQICEPSGHMEAKAGKQTRAKPGKLMPSKNLPAKRSWTQPDLDEAIREYKAKRSSTFADLVDGVRRGKTGAKKSARETYGRNAIARALGVKSAAMVSKSPVWKAIADDRSYDKSTAPPRDAARSKGSA